MTIFLCGFMGCGKTTIGKILAKKMGCNFYDTDEFIVENQGLTIPEIFSQKGEPYFRQIEAEVVKSMCGKKAIVACGGGAMLNPDTAEYANKSGKVIFLDVDFEVCYERIFGDDNRPIVASSTKEELHERYNVRKEIYNKHSTICIDANGSPMEIAETVRRSIC